MRAAIIAILILLMPAALLAERWMGVYFTYTPDQIWYNPAPFEYFTGYVYGHALNCYVNAVEFAVQLPPTGVIISAPAPDPSWWIPYEGSVTLGDPVAGLSVTYWPPLNGFDPGYNLLVGISFLSLPDLVCAGQNLPVRIIAHPVSGALQTSCWDPSSGANELVGVVGLTSYICLEGVATEETSWGAIKSLF